jgi:hypothetical protein
MPMFTLTQWQSLITHRGPNDACKGVQLLITALLGQIYGALSKVRRPDTKLLFGIHAYSCYHRTNLSAPQVKSFAHLDSSGQGIAEC